MDRKIVEWEREDYRAGIVGTMVGNFSGWRDKDSKAFEPADFFPSLPRWGKKRSRTASDDDNKAVIKMLMAQRKASERAKTGRSAENG